MVLSLLISVKLEGSGRKLKIILPKDNINIIMDSSKIKHTYFTIYYCTHKKCLDLVHTSVNSSKIS